MSIAPPPLRFVCEVVDRNGQATEVRASFQVEEQARAFVNRNPPPPGDLQWRIRDCQAQPTQS